MARDVIIIGAGGHAKVIADIVLCSGDNLIGFLDDNVELDVIVYKNYKVIGKISDLTEYRDKYYVVAIGNNYTRAKIARKYSDLKWYTAIHPKAVVADTVRIGDGTVVMAGVVINPDTIIGEHCIINTSCSIDHDNNIGNYVHVSPRACLAGTVNVGECSWICAGSSVINNVNIANDVVVGAGAVVIKDIDENGVYIGVPARRVK